MGQVILDDCNYSTHSHTLTAKDNGPPGEVLERRPPAESVLWDFRGRVSRPDGPELGELFSPGSVRSGPGWRGTGGGSE